MEGAAGGAAGAAFAAFGGKGEASLRPAAPFLTYPSSALSPIPLLPLKRIPELLLHWIWKHRLYEPTALHTLTGEPVEVRSPGTFSSHGPDFQGAHITLQGTHWIGSIEIDVYPALWYAHAHHEKAAYRTVILHVVWQASADASTRDVDGREIPILPLAPAVREETVKRFSVGGRALPCAALASTRPASEWLALYDRWGEERLQRRHQSYRNEAELLQAFWTALLYSFGVPDSTPYLRVAEALPWATLSRYAETLILKESALLGVAGLLERVSSPREPYEKELLEAWKYHQRKMGWTPLSLRWRMARPAASPWVRLTRLAALIQAYPSLLDLFLHPPADFPLPSPYWQRHYAWQCALPKPLRRTPRLLYQNVLINAIYPFAIYYLRSIGRVEEALEQLERFRQLPPEKHRYARLYAQYAYPAQNAWQTQGQLQLWRDACQAQLCLHCPIGNALLKS